MHDIRFFSGINMDTPRQFPPAKHESTRSHSFPTRSEATNTTTTTTTSHLASSASSASQLSDILPFFEDHQSTSLSSSPSASSSREGGPSPPAYTTATDAVHISHSSSSASSSSSSAFLDNAALHAISSPRPYTAFDDLPPEFSEKGWPTTSQLQQTEPSSLISFEASAFTPPASAEISDDMSTLAVQYDGPFMAAPRSSFTAWPEHDNMNHNLPLDHLSDHNLTPASTSSRSMTASPPRSALSPEQRDFNRYAHSVRRENKQAYRSRNGSASYDHSPLKPPMSLPESSSSSMSGHLPVYSTAPAPISLLAEPPTTLPPHPYTQPYSPPLSDSSPHAGYPSGYQPPMSSYSLSHMGYPPYSSHSSSYDRSSSIPPMFSVHPSAMNASSSIHPIEENRVRIVQTRPKPQCFEHGCNGRQFSTFSNLLRHQREKSGEAPKYLCPWCNIGFTRTTARNSHMEGKCPEKNRKMQTSTDADSNSDAENERLESENDRTIDGRLESDNDRMIDGRLVSGAIMDRAIDRRLGSESDSSEE